MSSPFDLIQKTVLINLDHRTDRLEGATKELERVGWKEWERFSAIKRYPAYMGFNRSQIESLKICAAHSGITAILEDDILFPFDKEKTQELLQKAFDAMPTNWTILYLGGMIFSGDYKGSIKSEGLATAHGLVCTHGMIYNEGVPEKILQGFNVASIYSQKKHIYDCWIANNYHKKDSCYLVNPMIAWQCAGYSDLSNEASVGTMMFELTQQKINLKL